MCQFTIYLTFNKLTKSSRHLLPIYISYILWWYLYWSVYDLKTMTIVCKVCCAVNFILVNVRMIFIQYIPIFCLHTIAHISSAIFTVVGRQERHIDEYFPLNIRSSRDVYFFLSYHTLTHTNSHTPHSHVCACVMCCFVMGLPYLDGYFVHTKQHIFERTHEYTNNLRKVRFYAWSIERTIQVYIFSMVQVVRMYLEVMVLLYTCEIRCVRVCVCLCCVCWLTCME